MDGSSVDVFVSGKEGYPCYRIPALLRLPGLLLLFAEGRRGGDDGSTDIVYKASANEGRSWSNLRVLHSEWEPPGHGPHAYIKNMTFSTTHTFWARDGYFHAGHDWHVEERNLTLGDAKALCAQSIDCFGFDFIAHDRAPPATQYLHCAFKRYGATFSPDVGKIVTIHNPCPIAVNGRALVVFGRNRGQILTMRALDTNATQWGGLKVVQALANRTGRINPGPPGGIAFSLDGKSSQVESSQVESRHQRKSSQDGALDSTLTTAVAAAAPTASSERIGVAIGGSMLVGGAALLSDDGGHSW